MPIERDEESSIRDDVTRAFEASETPEVEAAPESVDVDLTDDAPEEKPATGRERDESGRFQPKAAKTRTEAAAPAAKGNQAARTREQAAAAVAQVQGQPDVKAPQSWKPAAREKWSALPPEAKAEIARRESEIAKAMMESAPAKQFQQEFNRLTQPFAPVVQAQGGPLKSYENFLHHANLLQLGTPVQKAGLVAHLVKSFGIDINQLAAALDGQPAQAQQAQPHFDPQQLAAQVRQQVMGELQQQRTQHLGSQSAQEVESFGQEREFFDDVREVMADLMETHARAGRALTLEDAYNRAVQMHPDVSDVLRQRSEAEAANAKLASTQRTRVAASSVRSRPSGVSTSEAPKDLKGDIMASIAALANR